MITEVDTCRKYILPKFFEAGWDNEPYSLYRTKNLYKWSQHRFWPKSPSSLTETRFLIPDVLKVPPISEHGNVVEIANLFGGSDQLREAIHRLQTLLYAA